MTKENKYTTQKITNIKKWTDFLFSFRTTRSSDFTFIPGQFTRLGLNIADANNPEIINTISRPYSVVSANDDNELEFYSIVVPNGEFTQKLSNIKVNDEILVDKVSYGQLTPDKFQNGKHLWLLSTGTGLGPFISILYDLKIYQQYEKVIIVHCARVKQELAYQDTINNFYLDPKYASSVKDKLMYVRMLTRETDGADLYCRITDALNNGQLENYTSTPINVADSRIMLCGNPEMVNESRRILTERGLTLSKRNLPGNMAVENYW